MNKKLKFRVWNESKNKYYYFDFYTLVKDCMNGNMIVDDINFNSSEQTTGIIDKNGKEIYKGDIVRWTTTEVGCSYSNALCNIISYDKFTGSVLVGNIPYRVLTEESGYFQSNLEVIGNIPENPELLDII